MINKIVGTKNGYRFDESFNNEEFQGILRNRPVIRRIIVNSVLRKKFSQSEFGDDTFMISNKLANNEFYINSVN